MSILSFIFVSIVALVAPTNGIGWLFPEDSKKNLDLEILKKIEIDRIKSRILEQLGMTEPPILSHPSSHLSGDVIQMLVEQEEFVLSSKLQNSLARLFLFPTNRNFECLRNAVPSCRRFEFDIPLDTEDSKPEFWIHKINSSEFDELTISTFYFFPGNENELTMEHTHIPEDDAQHKWMSLHFPDLEELISMQINLTYAVEVAGMIVGEDEHNMPFLKMTQHLDRSHRKRRSESSEKVETCKPIPFTVSFEDIGYGQWIEYPKSYEANLCSGYCLRATNHHETIIDLVFQSNSTLEQKHGRCWSTCCRPKSYDTLRLIYREKDNTIVDRHMTNMVVTACSCS